MINRYCQDYTTSRILENIRFVRGVVFSSNTKIATNRNKPGSINRLGNVGIYSNYLTASRPESMRNSFKEMTSRL